MTVEELAALIEEHGHAVEFDMPEDVYHRGGDLEEPSLSHSGAKLVLRSPALYRASLEEPREPSKAMNLGRAAHALVTGTGPELTVLRRWPPKTRAGDPVVDAHDRTSPSTREHEAALRTEGRIGVTVPELLTIERMAEALREHPLTSVFLENDRPRYSEVSAFWRDEATRVLLRARFDMVTEWRDGEFVVLDYKTTGQSADPDEFRWQIGRLGYYQQDPWYREGADTVAGMLWDSPGDVSHGFLFVVQETTYPFLVSYVQLTSEDRAIGAQRNAEARRRFAACMTSGVWPGYGSGIATVTVPNAREIAEETSTDDND